MISETNLNGYSTRQVLPFEMPAMPKAGIHVLDVKHSKCKAYVTFEDTEKIMGWLALVISHCGPTSKITIKVEEKIA